MSKIHQRRHDLSTFSATQIMRVRDKRNYTPKLLSRLSGWMATNASLSLQTFCLLGEIDGSQATTHGHQQSPDRRPSVLLPAATVFASFRAERRGRFPPQSGDLSTESRSLEHAPTRVFEPLELGMPWPIALSRSMLCPLSCALVNGNGEGNKMCLF